MPRRGVSTPNDFIKFEQALLRGGELPGMWRVGSGAWAGLCNTHFWVDRTTGICASIYSNFLPFVTPEAVTMYNDFELALYASL